MQQTYSDQWDELFRERFQSSIIFREARQQRGRNTCVDVLVENAEGYHGQFASRNCNKDTSLPRAKEASTPQGSEVRVVLELHRTMKRPCKNDSWE